MSEPSVPTTTKYPSPILPLPRRRPLLPLSGPTRRRDIVNSNMRPNSHTSSRSASTDGSRVIDEDFAEDGPPLPARHPSFLPHARGCRTRLTLDWNTSPLWYSAEPARTLPPRPPPVIPKYPWPVHPLPYRGTCGSDTLPPTRVKYPRATDAQELSDLAWISPPQWRPSLSLPMPAPLNDDAGISSLHLQSAGPLAGSLLDDNLLTRHASSVSRSPCLRLRAILYHGRDGSIFNSSSRTPPYAPLASNAITLAPIDDEDDMPLPVILVIPSTSPRSSISSRCSSLQNIPTRTAFALSTTMVTMDSMFIFNLPSLAPPASNVLTLALIYDEVDIPCPAFAILACSSISSRYSSLQNIPPRAPVPRFTTLRPADESRAMNDALRKSAAESSSASPPPRTSPQIFCVHMLNRHSVYRSTRSPAPGSMGRPFAHRLSTRLYDEGDSRCTAVVPQPPGS
ncbi:hypothetical protein HYPSUDRAFT_220318 [Hypholoma sublateritium FD-334 SS-4]|uniref:Uncharacterized protein n=1 Tax=Hypholoma sublateritium (strain FD-334 SS-4) TaxID=945553 RepID=A0A0D2N6Q4_HYPSF|nr:hypothetical protein HYPSUDRAFT_220318 [Hypholoma sublateritium FD-334 SS-4]